MAPMKSKHAGRGFGWWWSQTCCSRCSCRCNHLHKQLHCTDLPAPPATSRAELPLGTNKTGVFSFPSRLLGKETTETNKEGGRIRNGYRPVPSRGVMFGKG